MAQITATVTGTIAATITGTITGPIIVSAVCAGGPPGAVRALALAHPWR